MKALLNKTLINSNNNVLNFLESKKSKKLIVTSNPEIYMNALDNKKIYNLLLDNDVLIIPDSIAVSYALKVNFHKRVEPRPGVDLLVELLHKANSFGKRLYIYGATKDVNVKFKKYVNNNYKDIKVVGCKDGYIKDTNSIKQDIIIKKPDVIVCALGVPKQEVFLYDVMKELTSGILIGVGGSFDVLSGSIKRAPLVFRKLKLEWAYRIIKQPKRLKRFIKYNVRFGFFVTFVLPIQRIVNKKGSEKHDK